MNSSFFKVFASKSKNLSNALFAIHCSLFIDSGAGVFGVNAHAVAGKDSPMRAVADFFAEGNAVRALFHLRGGVADKRHQFKFFPATMLRQNVNARMFPEIPSVFQNRVRVADFAENVRSEISGIKAFIRKPVFLRGIFPVSIVGVNAHATEVEDLVADNGDGVPEFFPELFDEGFADLRIFRQRFREHVAGEGFAETVVLEFFAGRGFIDLVRLPVRIFPATPTLRRF